MGARGFAKNAAGKLPLTIQAKLVVPPQKGQGMCVR